MAGADSVTISTSAGQGDWIGVDNNAKYSIRQADSVTALTTAVNIIPKTAAERGQHHSATITNLSTDTVIYKVYVNDHITASTTIDSTDYWSQLGANIQVANGSTYAASWDGRYKWVAITAAANGDSTSADQHIAYFLSQ